MRPSRRQSDALLWGIFICAMVSCALIAVALVLGYVTVHNHPAPGPSATVGPRAVSTSHY